MYCSMLSTMTAITDHDRDPCNKYQEDRDMHIWSVKVAS